jgi:hypothetical protein
VNCYVCGGGSMSYPPSPAVAWIRVSPSGNVVRLCRRDLDHWFDDADNGTTEEPDDWGWGTIARPVWRLTLMESFMVESHQRNMAELYGR